MSHGLKKRARFGAQIPGPKPGGQRVKPHRVASPFGPPIPGPESGPKNGATRPAPNPTSRRPGAALARASGVSRPGVALHGPAGVAAGPSPRQRLQGGRVRVGLGDRRRDDPGNGSGVATAPGFSPVVGSRDCWCAPYSSADRCSFGVVRARIWPAFATRWPHRDRRPIGSLAARLSPRPRRVRSIRRRLLRSAILRRLLRRRRAMTTTPPTAAPSIGFSEFTAWPRWLWPRCCCGSSAGRAAAAVVCSAM
jgi:hypothetical protein